jgi:uncharacterized membrane protein YadS
VLPGRCCLPISSCALTFFQQREIEIRHRARKSQASVIQNEASFLWQQFPKFVLGFLLISTLTTVGFFSKPQTTDIANLSRWAFLLTFAGVGLRTNVREMMKQGFAHF